MLRFWHTTVEIEKVQPGMHMFKTMNPSLAQSQIEVSGVITLAALEQMKDSDGTEEGKKPRRALTSYNIFLYVFGHNRSKEIDSMT